MFDYKKVKLGAVLVGVVFAVGARAANQDLTTAREVFTKARQAVVNAKVVRYKGVLTATDWVAAFVPAMEGTVTVGERSKWDITAYRCKAKIKKADSDEFMELTTGSNGEVFYLIDPSTKTAYEDIDSAVLGSQGRNMGRLVLDEFSDPKAFEKELSADKLELDGVESVGGELCYKVHVTLANDEGEVVWHISKKDLLPRRRESFHERDGKTGIIRLTLTEVRANTKAPTHAGLFRLVVPAGFKKTDDFAP